jgi:hypothetical protein
LAFHSGHEADHSPPSSGEVKERVELYLHSLNTPSWRGAQGKQRGNRRIAIFKLYLNIHPHTGSAVLNNVYKYSAYQI